MDAQSPPKRMTRARAAAKSSEPAAKPTRAATAAAKAKAARSTTTNTSTTTTTRTAVKRKSPSDDEGEHEMQPAKKMTAVETKSTRGRGRPKKVAVEAPAPKPAPAPEPAPATTVRTRGRPKKTVEPVAVEPAKPTRATRTTKKTVADEAAAPEPIKKTTRGRPALSTSMAASTTRPLTKPAVKKTVKFEEPEKENMEPTTTATRKTSTKTSAAAPTTGLRGKPVRRGASTTAARAARSTRAAAGTANPSEKVEKSMPLSPKKVNQLTLNRVESDDELGMDEKLPVRQFKKQPIKPALSGTKPSSAAKVAAPVAENDENVFAISRTETEVNLMLATPAKRLPPTPWKGSIKSPARRVEGLVVASVTQTDAQTSQSPTKTGLLQSPAKRQPLNLNPLGHDCINGPNFSPIKLSFLSSPAKRPPISPIKPLPRHVEEEAPVNQSPAPKPTLLASPLPREVSDELEHNPATPEKGLLDQETTLESPARLDFPGRLSAVLPRHADPALTPQGLEDSENTAQSEAPEGPSEAATEDGNNVEDSGEPMMLDNPPVESATTDAASTTSPTSPPKSANPMFGLRDKDLYPQDHTDSDSDNDSPVRQGRFTSAFSALPATPCPVSANTPRGVPSTGRSTTRKLRSQDNLGFTPLAQQLSGWTAGPNPLKTDARPATPTTAFPVTGGQDQSALLVEKAASTPTEPAQNTFFDDEMHVRPDAMEVEEDEATEVEDNDDPVLEDLSFTEEDMELAAEANEMSLLEKGQGTHSSQDNDDSISQASQEYADENAIPIDPSLTAGNGSATPAVPPVTPQRVVHREFHTVAKVPLKAADNSTPRPKLENRSYSVSRIPVTRPTERLTRNATVISYSPTKGGETDIFEDEADEQGGSAPPVTPQKGDIWSTIGTPARTPRRDLNPALLRGAVVFVDVHTSEGADASTIFVELLTQMGARCVKTWAWNPNSSPEPGADSRVGITHVVYKDGGKRTLEKVRETGGLVQCVGVSWVLDCERENQWLDEAPYQIDTSLVPRGGARRRKSMEPRAIANLHGTLVPSPVQNNARGSQTAPNTPARNRRASSLWMLSPEKPLDDENGVIGGKHSYEDEDHDDDWELTPLTPVPKTPAPEAIARYVANISPGSTSPSSVGSADSDDPLARDEDERSRQEKLLRTCPPPKRTTFVELGSGVLGKEKDERVLMRLMAARRKSLQFAPKVGSPLAKAWKAWN